MSRYVISACLLIVAVIHLLPVAGVLGVDRLQSLYGESIDSNTMEILMRHRAILFGILGVFFAYAAFSPALQPLAFIAAAASILSFFYLAFTVGGYSPEVHRVVIADVVASAALVLAAGLFYLGPDSGG